MSPRIVLVAAALGALAPATAQAATHHRRAHKHAVSTKVASKLHHGRLGSFAHPKEVVKTAAGSTAAAAAELPAATPDGPRALLPEAQPDWATPDTAVGRIQPAATVPVTMTLGWQHPDELAALITAVTTPGSADYGKYLTPAQFRDRFAPSDEDQQAAAAYARSQGLTVDGVSANGSRLAAHGTAEQVSAAFGTVLNTYRVKGRTLRAPNRRPSVPASLKGIVTGVQGLDQAGAFTHPAASPPALFRNAQPCSAYFGEKVATDKPTAFGKAQPYATCGYTPAQVRGAYGLATGQDGAGTTVGIIDAYACPLIASDTNTWSGRHGVPPLATGQLDQSLTPYSLTQAPETYGTDEDGNVVPVDDPQGWCGEQTLDVEAVHGVAPKAGIVYAGARNPFDVALDDTLADVVDSGLTHIVSNSYGETDGDTTRTSRAAFDAIAQEAAATGVGLYFSSGDSGDEGKLSGKVQTDYPSSSPYVTAVGGTSLKVAQDNSNAGETYWGTDKSNLSQDGTAWEPAPGTPSAFQYGGGGGTSAIYDQPAYQAGVVPDALATKYKPGATAKHRVVPDVSAIGDPNTGYLVGQVQTAADGTTAYDEYRIGGTSLASPVVAAIMATVDQGRAAQAKAPVGFANPALYKLPAGAFHDVAGPSTPNEGVVRVDFANGEDAADGLLTSLRAFGDLQSLSSLTGYDDSTGRGTPNGAAFLSGLVG